MKMRMVLMLMSAAIVMASCSSRAGLAVHVNELLHRADVPQKDLSVAMGPRTRTGLAEFRANTGEVARIVSGLRLHRWHRNTDGSGTGSAENDSDMGDTGSAAGADVEAWLQKGRSQYGNEMLKLPEGVQVFYSAPRAPSLRLRDGSRFEYLVLLWQPAAETAVMLLEYASG